MSWTDLSELLATIIYPLLFGTSIVLALLAWLGRYPRLSRWEMVALHLTLAGAFAVAALISGIYSPLDRDTNAGFMRLCFAGALAIYLIALLRALAEIWRARHRPVDNEVR
jgi:hypothetical protein